MLDLTSELIRKSKLPSLFVGGKISENSLRGEFSCGCEKHETTTFFEGLYFTKKKTLYEKTRTIKSLKEEEIPSGTKWGVGWNNNIISDVTHYGQSFINNQRKRNYKCVVNDREFALENLKHAK